MSIIFFLLVMTQRALLKSNNNLFSLNNMELKNQFDVDPKSTFRSAHRFVKLTSKFQIQVNKEEKESHPISQTCKISN